MPSEISYDPSLNGDAGFLEVKSEPVPTEQVKEAHMRALAQDKWALLKTPLRERDGQTLLHLMFHFVYTHEGRQLLRSNPPDNGKLSDIQKNILRKKFTELGVTDEKVQNAILAVHEAGNSWAQEYRKGAAGNARREEFEKVYLQQMAFLTWCLWEDAKGHEFSMIW